MNVFGELLLEGGAPYGPVDDELAIRQLPRLDVTDLDQVQQFVADHGAVSLKDPFDWAFGLDPDGSPSRRPRRFSVEWRHLFDYDPLLEWPNSWPSVAVRLAAVRRLSQHYIRRASDQNSIDIWSGARPPIRAQLQADDRFVEELNNGLSQFHLRIFTKRSSASGQESEWGLARHDLIDVLHLQLWNLVVESLPLRQCDFCGVDFVRQAGRAQHGQYRTSGEVLYCSRRCARNSAQRSYRERKRAEKKV
ncbi:MAG: hypothetical protein CL424_07795 [Acidimicrobiaceae bacterium]|nr:hypothetical protein [Acidimicrobiaceae bacterium]